MSKHLLSPASRSVVNPVKLSAEQTRVLNAVQSGKNIFFTGSAGTGKSFLLRRIIGKKSYTIAHGLLIYP